MPDVTSNVDAIRGAVRRLNAGDLDGYLDSFTPECLRWVPGLTDPLSLSEIRTALQFVTQALSDCRLEEVLLFGDGRHVCAHWRLVGTHTGDYLDIAPTNRLVCVDTAEIYEFESKEGGLVCSSRAFGDPMAMIHQLSAAVPSAGGGHS